MLSRIRSGAPATWAAAPAPFHNHRHRCLDDERRLPFNHDARLAVLVSLDRLWRARPVSRSARCCLSWYSHSVRPPRQRPILRNRWPFQVGMRSPSRSRASPTRSCSSPTNPSPPRPAHAPSPPLCPSRRRRQQQLQLQRQQQQHRVSVTAVPRELARRWLRRSLQQRSAGRLSEKRWRANSAGCARRRRRTRRC